MTSQINIADKSTAIAACAHRRCAASALPPTRSSLEAFLDEVALKRGIDAVQLRLELLKNTPRGRAVVERVAQMANWGRSRRTATPSASPSSTIRTVCSAGLPIFRSIARAVRFRVHNFWCAIDLRHSNAARQCGRPD